MRNGFGDIALGMIFGAGLTAVIGAALFFLSATNSIGQTAATPMATVQQQPVVATATDPAPPTLVASPTPLSTSKPTPVAATTTPDAVQQALDGGSIVFAGPLSNEEQVAVYRSSLNYVRSTVADSQLLAKQINGVGYGDPSNICGPLAIAILRDAGLLPNNIIPHDFWLLDPNAAIDARTIERAFPWDQYSHMIIAAPINKVDWNSWPLFPGDFVFIWHGPGGNFDHMLVVTRVDRNSRVYTVTNFGASDGYMIEEAPLYDPSDPSVGLFHQWTAERNAILGSTGFGGFEVWRRRGP